MSRTRRSAKAARRAGRSAYSVAVNVVLTGIVVIVPLVVTLYVLSAALGFIASALNPVIKVLRWAGLLAGVKRNVVVESLVTVGIYENAVHFLTEITALVILAMLIVFIGTAAHFQYGEQVIHYFDRTMARLPAVGAVYRSFRRMGDVMLESDVEMSVEAAVSVIITSGIATDDPESEEFRDLSDEEKRGIAGG